MSDMGSEEKLGFGEKVDSGEKEEGLLQSDEVDSKKCCAVCKATKTPLWRSGPAGPKSLCNACGIRSKKKIPLGVKNGQIGKGNMKLNAMPPFGMMKKHRTTAERPSGQWGEVETAALLLMALSCGAEFTD